jgi:hypothetical protein
VGEFWRLVGATLLGALISFGTTFYFERRKEQRAERAEQQERGRQLRQAGRLVYEELNNAWIVLDRTTDTEVWWSDPPHDLESSAWDEYKATLARLLDKDAWSAVGDAYSSMAEFNMRLAMGREGKEVPSPVLDPPPDEEEGFVSYLEPIRDKFPTSEWALEVLYVFERVDAAMKLLAREFLSEGSQTKVRPKIQK